MNPIQAIQLATINNARHWQKVDDVGVIAPGRYADILLVSDLRTFSIEKVIANGAIVAEKGSMTVDIQIPPIPSYATNTIRFPRHLIPDDFVVKAPNGKHRVYAAVLRPFYFSEDLGPITHELTVKDGAVQRDLANDVNKVAIIRRDGRGMGISFWELGYQRGAVAMSILHDSHNISVVGATDVEMADASNRVAELGGGIVVVEGGEVRAEIALPVAGLMTDRPLNEVVSALERVNEEAARLKPGKLLGNNPVDTQTFIFLTCYPWGTVLTDRGLFNVRSGEKVSTVW